MKPTGSPKTTAKSAQPARPTRPTKRFLLPSSRVAEFSIPNVGELIALRRKAFSIAGKGLKPGERPSEYDLGFVMGDLVLHQLLTGLSERPVPSIFIAGFSEEAARADAIANGVEDIGEAVQIAMLRAEDSEAMKVSAQLSPVTDFVWHTGAGYLGTLATAELGTEQAADWEALQQAALSLVQQFESGGPPGPKARAQMMRSLR